MEVRKLLFLFVILTHTCLDWIEDNVKTTDTRSRQDLAVDALISFK
jgi:hypothetical protein